jgi:hypothetical protein
MDVAKSGLDDDEGGDIFVVVAVVAATCAMGVLRYSEVLREAGGRGVVELLRGDRECDCFSSMEGNTERSLDSALR